MVRPRILREVNISLELRDYLLGPEPLIVILGDSRLTKFENQRAIQLAREFSLNNLKVVFIHWEWTSYPTFNHFFSDSNLLHISMNDDLAVEQLRKREFFSHFLVTLPTQKFLSIVLYLKQPGDKISYDIMDNWSGFHKVGQAPWFVDEIEKEFVKISDSISAVTQPLVDKFQQFRKLPIRIIENGTLTEFKVFSQGELNFIPRQINKVIYAGSLETGWIDVPLIWKVLELNDRISLTIAGNTDDLLVPKHMKDRVNLVGWKTPRELKELYLNSDIGLVPFRENEVSIGVNPIKYYDYIGCGLPSLIFGLPHQAHLTGGYYFSNPNELRKWLYREDTFQVHLPQFRSWNDCSIEVGKNMGLFT